MFSLKRNKKINRDKSGIQTRRSIFWQHKKGMINWDASFYSVSQFLNNFPDLHLFTSSDFSSDRWNLTAPFPDKSHGVLNN